MNWESHCCMQELTNFVLWHCSAYSVQLLYIRFLSRTVLHLSQNRALPRISVFFLTYSCLDLICFSSTRWAFSTITTFCFVAIDLSSFRSVIACLAKLWREHSRLNVVKTVRRCLKTIFSLNCLIRLVWLLRYLKQELSLSLYKWRFTSSKKPLYLVLLLKVM